MEQKINCFKFRLNWKLVHNTFFIILFIGIFFSLFSCKKNKMVQEHFSINIDGVSHDFSDYYFQGGTDSGELKITATSSSYYLKIFILDFSGEGSYSPMKNPSYGTGPINFTDKSIDESYWVTDREESYSNVCSTTITNYEVSNNLVVLEGSFEAFLESTDDPNETISVSCQFGMNRE